MGSGAAVVVQLPKVTNNHTHYKLQLCLLQATSGWFTNMSPCTVEEGTHAPMMADKGNAELTVSVGIGLSQHQPLSLLDAEVGLQLRPLL